jgi:flagellar hook-associated protein 2
MSGVTSGVGIFSGIDRNQIISQLLAIEGRAKQPIQRRIGSLQGLQAAYLDVTSKLSSLRTTAQSFRIDRAFELAAASSSNADVVRATASTGAPAGEYRVTVARLASTQQVLSRSLADQNITGLGLSEVVFEGAEGRLDAETKLAGLRGGQGVARGTIQIRDGTGATATVDLTRATTISDVVTAINQQTGVRVRARVDDVRGTGFRAGDGLVIEDISGGTGALTISDFGPTNTATELGIAGTVNQGQRLDNNDASQVATTRATIRGLRINTLGDNSALSTLNDGLGVGFNRAIGVAGAPTPDLTVTVTGTGAASFKVDLGEVYDANGLRTRSAATTLGEVIARFNEAAAASGTTVRADYNADRTGLRLEGQAGTASIAVVAEAGSTAAADLGILGSVNGTRLDGARLNSSINSVQVARLGGGTGVGFDDLSVTLRSGVTLAIIAAVDGSVSDLLDSINSASGNNGRLTASLDSSGNRLVLRDTTSGTALTNISGGLAGALELPTSFVGGAAASGRLQRQYVGENTELSRLNYGRGVGVGSFEITSSSGFRRTVSIGASVRTVGEVIQAINSAGNENGTQRFRARINDTGDGILVEDDSAGGNNLTIRDTSGGVARNLFLAGEADTAGNASINGSSERRIVVNPADTLEQVTTKINNANLNIRASVLRDGSASPFRLAVSSRTTGASGAFTLDTVGADLGLSTSTQGRDALVFYGSDDPTRALAVESSSNTVSGAIPNVSLELRSVSTTPVTIGVTPDIEKITEKVNAFVEGFNALIDSISSRATFDADANKRGVLLGDSVTGELRSGLQRLVQGRAQGVSGQFSFLFDVGISLTTGGKIKLDDAKLRAALERDPRGVTDLFAARVQAPSTQRVIPGGTVNETVPGAITAKGVMEIIADELDRYNRSTDGVLTRSQRTLDEQIKANNTRIATIDARIASRRDRLERQFIQMESTIGRLQGQQSSVGNIRQVTG